MDALYRQFTTERYNAAGELCELGFRHADDFNYAYDVLDILARRYPNERALVWLNADRSDRRVFSFSDIAAQSRRAANLFYSSGIHKGDVVLLTLKRHHAFWPIMMALCRIGAVAVPCSFMLTKEDYEYRLHLARAKAVVALSDDAIAGPIDAALPQCPGVSLRFCVGSARAGWVDYERESAALPDSFERKTGDEATRAHDHMLMYFTSGTTSYPKLAAHDFTYPLGHIATAVYWQQVRRGGLHLTISDTGWSKSAWGKLYGQWLGESAVLAYDFDKWSAADMLEVVESERVTTFCAPPTMYRFMIHEDLARFDLSSIGHACTAGEALNPEVYKRFFAATGLGIYEGFGQTETTVAVFNGPGRAPKVGALGRPSPAFDIRLVDADGREVEPGQPGEIAIKTGGKKPVGLFCGYVHDEVTTARVFANGIYRTGDVAWADEDGYLHYVGRTDDLIKTSGYRVSPFEVESVLMEHAAVLECAVTGVPDELRGQLIKASVTLAPGYVPSAALAQEIKDYVKSRTAPYKYPRIVEFLDELPKTASGKIRRCELRA